MLGLVTRLRVRQVRKKIVHLMPVVAKAAAYLHHRRSCAVFGKMCVQGVDDLPEFVADFVEGIVSLG